MGDSNDDNDNDSVALKTAEGDTSSPILDNGNASSSSSSSSSASSSSDVERMLRKVRKRKEKESAANKAAKDNRTTKRRSGNSSSRPEVHASSSPCNNNNNTTRNEDSNSNSSDDDSNDDDDSDNNAGHSLEGRYATAATVAASASRRRKNARVGVPQVRRSVTSELAEMERRDLLQRRAREQRDRGRRRGSGYGSSSDSDASVREESVPQNKPRDRNAISIVMECTAEGVVGPPPPHKGATQEEAISVDDDSSSSVDEGVDAKKVPVALPQSEVLSELAKAAAALQQAQHADLDQTVDLTGAADVVRPSQNPSMQEPPILVVVVVERERPGSAEVFEPQTLSLSIRRHDPLSTLIGLVLDHLGLTPATAIVHLTSMSQQQTLHPRHTAESYQLSSGCAVRAKVLLKGLGHDSGTGVGPSAASLGRGLTLKFRRPNGTEVAVEARSKEPLQAVADRFRLQASLPPATQISLSFDGAPVPLHQTPDVLDMESDDLIDVVET